MDYVTPHYLTLDNEYHRREKKVWVAAVTAGQFPGGSFILECSSMDSGEA